ncbi:psmG2 [Scenedesmus sp. PABB004]|nr:psmG2 [Scenedesmus sp. PABB004]
MELVPDDAGAPPDLAGGVLLAPAVAFANIGELALDALIASLGAARVARLDDANVLAVVGNNAFTPDPPGLLATALELYSVPGSRLFLLQQRAPAIPGRQAALAADLAGWAQRAGLAHVVLLCGLDAQYRREQQLEGSQLRFLAAGGGGQQQQAPAAAGGAAAAAAAAEAAAAGGASGSSGGTAAGGAGAPLAAACQAAGLLALEPDVEATEREVHGLLPPWPQLDALAGVGLAATLLATFAAEGDNVADALALAAAALGALRGAGSLPASGGEGQQQLRVPCSWAGLYGRSFDRSLF